MSERYSKLFALSENLYSIASPVVIAAGALQKDNQSGKVFAQLKMRSIQDNPIKAATVRLSPLDTVGKPLGEAFDYQYLDLSVKRDADFGQKTLIPFKDMATRAFTVSVSEVYFSDNSVWTASGGAWEPLSPPVTLETAFSDNELVKQYRIKYGAGCKCTFKKEKDLWYCACGALNRDSETNCHSCQREAAALAALDIEELKTERDQRLAAEQKKREEELAAKKAAEEKAAAERKAAEEKAAAERKAAMEKAAAEAEERARRIKKIAMIATPIVVVVIIAAVLFSNYKKAQQEEAARLEAYNAAVALVEAGQYDEAVTAFTELGDYKDSAEQMTEIRYIQALSMFQSKRYADAINVFSELGDYKDSAELANNITDYSTAIALMNGGDFEAAEIIFSTLGDFEDCADWLAQPDFMKPYFPYIGEFVCIVYEMEVHLTSDFAIYGGNVCWEVDFYYLSPDGRASNELIPFGQIGIIIDDELHCYFTDCPVEDLIVSKEMTVTDTWDVLTLTAKFENGEILISGKSTWLDFNGRDKAVKEYYNRQYTKVE